MKDWLIRLGLNEAGPSAIRGAILGVSGWILVRNGALTHFGIISDVAAHTTTIHWDQLSVAAIASLPAIIAAVIKLFQVHGENVINVIKGPPMPPEPPK
jgi:hypothetical protein